MAANLGAHEVMEVHEILTGAINTVNHFQLLRPYVKDQQLRQMLENQLQFTVQEYNSMVQMLQQEGMGQAASYRSLQHTAPAPVYGLDNPGTQTPNLTVNQMDDRDVASAMLGCHKASAAKKMVGALECANPRLRQMLQQGAINCSEQAYEVWQYMNHKGYYQVPTMKEMTTNTIVNMYTQAGAMSAGNQQMSNRANFMQ